MLLVAIWRSEARVQARVGADRALARLTCFQRKSNRHAKRSGPFHNGEPHPACKEFFKVARPAQMRLAPEAACELYFAVCFSFNADLKGFLLFDCIFMR